VGALTLFVSAGVALAAPGGAATDLEDAFWLEAVGGSWSDASRWSTDVAPNNDDGRFFRASISVNTGPYTVHLDEDVEIGELAFAASMATIDVRSRSLRVLGSATLGAGVLRGDAHGALRFGGVFNPSDPFQRTIFAGTRVRDVGLLEVTGASQFSGADISGVSEVRLDGDAVLDSTSIRGLEGEMVALSTTAQSTTSLINYNLSSVMFTLRGTARFDATLMADIDDTCIDLALADLSLGGAVGPTFRGNSDIMVRDGSSLKITGGADRVSTGEGPGTQQIVIDAGGGFELSDGGTFELRGVDVVNDGTVAVRSGKLMTDGVDVQNNRLEGGRWVVQNNAELSLENAVVTELAAAVELRGAGSTFNAIDGLDTVAAGGRLDVMEGRAFQTQGAFMVGSGGSLAVGDGSSFDATGGLMNLSGGVLSGGALEVAGTLSASNADAIERVENDVTLSGDGIIRGPGASDAIVGLTSIGETGSVSALDGRDILGLSSLTVEGALRVGVSADVSGTRAGELVAEGAHIEVLGDYVQAEGSELIFQIGDGSFGSLAVGGDLIFGTDDEPGEAGTLRFEVVGDIELGDSFQLISADNILGTFAAIEGLDVGGVRLQLEFDDQGLSVTVVPIPTPSALGLFALAGVLGTRRRR
jgi:hypothetical protein